MRSTAMPSSKSLYGGAAKPANCAYVVDQLLPAGHRHLCVRPGEGEEACWTRPDGRKINGDKPITWLTYYTTPLATNVLAAVQAMLAQVGINVVPRAVDTPTYNSIVSTRTPDYRAVPAGLCRAAERA